MECKILPQMFMMHCAWYFGLCICITVHLCVEAADLAAWPHSGAVIRSMLLLDLIMMMAVCLRGSSDQLCGDDLSDQPGIIIYHPADCQDHCGSRHISFMSAFKKHGMLHSVLSWLNVECWYFCCKAKPSTCKCRYFCCKAKPFTYKSTHWFSKG